jgi:hypothetical protein
MVPGEHGSKITRLANARPPKVGATSRSAGRRLRAERVTKRLIRRVPAETKNSATLFPHEVDVLL